MKAQFTSLYAHNRARSKVFATTNTEDSLTQKSDAAETDINIIMKRYATGGQLPAIIQQPLYGDFTAATDYRDMMDKIREANAAFQQIPAKVRERFNNDPANFMEFIRDPENIDEMRKLGLAEPPKEAPKPPEPMLVKVVPDEPK